MLWLEGLGNEQDKHVPNRLPLPALGRFPLLDGGGDGLTEGH